MNASARLASIGVALNVVAGDRHRALDGAMIPARQRKRRRLSGAVRADETEDLAGTDVEGDAIARR